MAVPDARLAALSRWAADVLADRDCDIRPASADASFRRYFRVRRADGTSCIVMDAPPDKEDSRPYIAVARRLRALGLNVPEILAEDMPRGFLLITDLGSQPYLAALNPESVESLYHDALAALVVLQAGIHTDSGFLPPYDAALLRREMELFREWYLGRHLGLRLSDAHQATLDRSFAALTESALAQPQVWVHRDYHSRNLMVCPRHNPGILDFQDAVTGPVTYDLVSLLRDCYIAWPRAQVERRAVRRELFVPLRFEPGAALARYRGRRRISRARIWAVGVQNCLELSRHEPSWRDRAGSPLQEGRAILPHLYPHHHARRLA